MKAQRWSEIQKKGKLGPVALERARREARAEVLEMSLRALRESAGKTQEEMAELTEMSQPQLSRFERREDCLVSTLRRYVEALGGEVEIVAVVGGKRIKLSGL